MDGFRERLSGRYDRSGLRGGAHDRAASDDRYENDRYERAPRRGTSDGISQEAIGEAVNEAVTKANQEQLDVIADFFDEAKADRMESERAIIDAFSHGLGEVMSAGRTESVPAPAPAPAQPESPIAVVDEQNAETLARIERIAGQNAEALSENSEMLEHNVDSLRSNAEVLNDIRTKILELVSSSEQMKDSSSELNESIRQSINEMSSRAVVPAPVPDLTVDFTEEKNEIIGAVGDNRAILNMIRQDVLNGFARTAESEAGEEEKIIPLSAQDADNYYRELEDHVHKECVKCYRNVQSALTEQGAEANKGLEKQVAGLRIMVLLSLIAGAIGAVAGIIGVLIGLGIFALPY